MVAALALDLGCPAVVHGVNKRSSPSAPRRPQRDDCLHGLAPQGDLVAVEEPERATLKIGET